MVLNRQLTIISGGKIMSDKKYFCLHLSGLVQGVGMRYYVEKVAGELGLMGYVRNLPDGRVECVIYETHENLEHFITLIEKSPRGKIESIAVSDWQETEKFNDFVIRY
jgi:acylphosphatase